MVTILYFQRTIRIKGAISPAAIRMPKAETSAQQGLGQSPLPASTVRRSPFRDGTVYGSRTRREGRMDRNTTPTLSELLADPIVIAVMTRDGISPDSIQQLFERLRRSRRVQEQRLAA